MALRNLFGELGLESTLQSILSALTGGTLKVVSPGENKVLVGNAQEKFRDDFFSLDADKWEVVQTGTGHTVDVQGATTRFLNINTGTTAATETILLSKSTFSPPFKIGVGISLSQRVAGQQFVIEAVGVDDDGNVETDTTFAAPVSLNATNCAGFVFDGTSSTAAKSLLRTSGTPEVVGSTQTITTTTATGTSPNFVGRCAAEWQVDTEEVVFMSRDIDTANNATALTKRTQGVPAPEKRYKLRIRAANTSAVVATDMRVHFVRVVDVTRLTVDMTRHMGRADASVSIPVNVNGTVTTATFSSVGLSAVTVGRYTETTTAILAASGVQTGSSRRAVGWSNSSASYPIFAVDCFSPTDGVLKTQGSTDGTTWWDTQIQPVTAGQPVQIVRRAVWEYNRAIFTNGSTPMTTGNPLRLGTSMQLS